MSPHRSRLRLGLAATIVLATGLMAGCGGTPSNGEEKLSARQIITDASKATGSAQSVRVSGKGMVNDLAVQVDVSDGQGKGGGSITIGGSTIQLVLAGQDFYLKTTPAVIQQLTGSQAIAEQDANQWLQTAATNSSVSQLVPLLDIGKLASNSFTFTGVPEKQKVTTFNGQSAIPVVDPQGGDTVFVAATGKPYILGIRGAASAGGSTLTYADYGRAVVPGPPPGAIKLTQPSS